MNNINKLGENSDLDKFMRRDVPMIIGLGLVILLGTFLGPLGILLVIGAIAGAIYYAFREF